MKSGQLQINELRNILNEHFHWHKTRLECFVSMLLELLAVNTVNLTQLAVAFPGRTVYPACDSAEGKQSRHPKSRVQSFEVVLRSQHRACEDVGEAARTQGVIVKSGVWGSDRVAAITANF